MKVKLHEVKDKIDIWYETQNFRWRKYKSQHPRFVEIMKLILLIIMILGLVSAVSTGLYYSFKSQINYAQNMDLELSIFLEENHFEQVPKSNLCYDENTQIVYYIMFIEDTVFGRSFGLMSPYYSENGKICRYIDNEIIEIE